MKVIERPIKRELAGRIDRFLREARAGKRLLVLDVVTVRLISDAIEQGVPLPGFADTVEAYALGDAPARTYAWLKSWFHTYLTHVPPPTLRDLAEEASRVELELREENYGAKARPNPCHGNDGGWIGRSSPPPPPPSIDKQLLVDQLIEMLLVVEGKVMTRKIAEERARNIAAAWAELGR